MADTDISIREATLDDVIGIVYVQATTWIASYPNDYNGISEADIRSIDFQAKIKEWQHMLQSPNYRVWVAGNAENIIGVLAARRDGDAHEIYEQCVLPDYQRQGFGSQLLDAALAWLGGDQSVSLRIISYNQAGVEFYKKFGFKISELGEVDFIRLPTGKNIPTLEMRRGDPVKVEPFEDVLPPAEPDADEKPPAENTGSILENNHPAEPKLVGRARLAKLANMRASTIKFYTEIGILPYEQAEERLARRYEVAPTLERLKEIQELRKQGLSIKEITERYNT